MNNFSALKTFESLKDREFRIYFLSMLGQWAGQAMQNVMQGLLLYRLTGSTAILGTMSLANAIPQVGVALFAGVLVDRYSKKRLMQIGQGVTALTAFIIAIALWTGVLSKAHAGSWWILIVIAVIQGVSGAILWAARSAIVPELVSKNHVPNATSLTTIGLNIFQLVSPALGGFLIDKINFEAVYLVIGGFYLVSMFITNLVSSGKVIPSGGRQLLAEVVAGLKYSAKNPVLLWVVLYTLFCSMIVLPLGAMISVFSDSILKVSGTGLGLLQGFSAAGALVTVLVIATMNIRKPGLLMLITGLVMGLAQTAFAFSTSYPLSLVIMIFVGAGTMGQITLAMILLQIHADPNQRGRVLSLLLLGIGISGLMTFGAGFVAEVIGIQWTIGGASILLCVATVLVYFIVPQLRKTD